MWSNITFKSCHNLKEQVEDRRKLPYNMVKVWNKLRGKRVLGDIE